MSKEQEGSSNWNSKKKYLYLSKFESYQQNDEQWKKDLEKRISIIAGFSLLSFIIAGTTLCVALFMKMN